MRSCIKEPKCQMRSIFERGEQEPGSGSVREISGIREHGTRLRTHSRNTFLEVCRAPIFLARSP